MVLLDTNALLWFFIGDERLSIQARTSLEGDPGNYLVSAISLWEIAIKRQIGKLTSDLDFAQAVKDAGFVILDLTTSHINTYESLPMIHRDSFNRMLVSQSKSEKIPFLSSDIKLKEYGIKLISATGNKSH